MHWIVGWKDGFGLFPISNRIGKYEGSEGNGE